VSGGRGEAVRAGISWRRRVETDGERMGDKANGCHSFYRTAAGRWIVTAEDAAFDVFGGERSPETTVEAVGGVVTQDKVVVRRDGVILREVQH